MRNYFFQASEVYPQIAMKHKTVLPDEGFESRRMVVHGNGLMLDVYCKPRNPSNEPNQWGYRRRDSSHRVIAWCPCGREIPFGRLGQHMKACDLLRDRKRMYD
jgi:hypothetical protein